MLNARVRLPVRTALLQNSGLLRLLSDVCDYQSERHCSKTTDACRRTLTSAITSQNGTAPKQGLHFSPPLDSAITSQNGTAPKRSLDNDECGRSAITSQNGTAPKPGGVRRWYLFGAITSQNGTAPKPAPWSPSP